MYGTFNRVYRVSFSFFYLITSRSFQLCPTFLKNGFWRHHFRKTNPDDVKRKMYTILFLERDKSFLWKCQNHFEQMPKSLWAFRQFFNFFKVFFFEGIISEKPTLMKKMMMLKEKCTQYRSFVRFCLRPIINCYKSFWSKTRPLNYIRRKEKRPLQPEENLLQN